VLYLHSSLYPAFLLDGFTLSYNPPALRYELLLDDDRLVDQLLQVSAFLRAGTSTLDAAQVVAHPSGSLARLHLTTCAARVERYPELVNLLNGTRTAAACAFLGRLGLTSG
jgi:hypothetical protein